MPIGKRKGKVVKGAGNPGSSGSDAVGGSLSKNDHWYLQQGFGFGGQPGAVVETDGHEASGGSVSDYADPTGVKWRAHVFAQTGTFTITSLSAVHPATVEYLVVGGGGGGGGAIGPSSPENAGGGGGAGGLKTNYPGVSDTDGTNLTQPSYTVTASAYTVVVGGGGGGGGRHYDSPNPNTQSISTNGSNSAFYPAPVSSPHPTYVGTVGGGRGGDAPKPGGSNTGGDGGSGGGGANSGGNGGGGDGTSGQGRNGGGCGPGSGYNNAGGGGGAGYTGQTGGSPGGASGPGGHGGAGVQVLIAGPTNDAVGGPGPSPATAGGWFAGGGGGSTHDGPPTTFGAGGSWSNPSTLSPGGPYSGGGQGWPGDTNQTSKPQTEAMNGLVTSGGGGGGASAGVGGRGGSGVVVVRYKIGGSQTGTAKATGGSISYTPAPVGLTIHTFFTSGTFTVTDGPLSCKVICQGGGGGGGAWVAGGGGAGGLAYTDPTQSQAFTDSTAYSILVGGGGQGGWVDPGGQADVPANPQAPGDKVGQNAGDSTITHPTLSPTIIGKGGGGGGAYHSTGGPNPMNVGRSAGCGGGGSATHPGAGTGGGSSTQASQSNPTNMTEAGSAGGTGGPSPLYNGGGGGGTQGVGGNYDDVGPASDRGGGDGGTGTGAPLIPFYPYIGIKTPDNTFGGGGGGSNYNGSDDTAVPAHGLGKGGGGNGATGGALQTPGGHALAGTGSGGGGSGYKGGDPQNLPGGNGEKFNWRILREFKPKRKWMLAGGLDIHNISEAINITNPPAIDISSGLEIKKGIKNAKLIEDFVIKCRNI